MRWVERLRVSNRRPLKFAFYRGNRHLILFDPTHLRGRAGPFSMDYRVERNRTLKLGYGDGKPTDLGDCNRGSL